MGSVKRMVLRWDWFVFPLSIRQEGYLSEAALIEHCPDCSYQNAEEIYHPAGTSIGDKGETAMVVLEWLELL
jgi:hypothetical protein